MNVNQLEDLQNDILEMKADKVGASQILAYVSRVIQKAVNKKRPAENGKASSHRFEPEEAKK